MNERPEPRRLRLVPLREMVRQLSLFCAVMLGAVLLAIGVAWVLLLLYLRASWERMDQTTSPDGRAVATVWRQNLGAWDDFTTIGTLHAPTERPTPHDGFRFFIAEGYPRIRLEWGVGRAEPWLCVYYQHDNYFRHERAWGSMPIVFHRQ